MGIPIRAIAANGLVEIQQLQQDQWKPFVVLTSEEALTLSYSIQDGVRKDVEEWQHKLDAIKKAYEPKMPEH